jgi:inosine-uridine nucleoside N-ribohydrolase
MEFQFDESGLDGGYMHDPLAVAAALVPNILETLDLPVDVVTDGPDRGRTVRGSVQAHAAAAGRGVHVAFSHDDDTVLRLLEQRVLRPVFGATLPR